MLRFSGAALVTLGLAFGAIAPANAEVDVGISVGLPPPALPIYEQPPMPAPGYLWTPGYWAYDPDIGDYYWVPGTWVLPPHIGFLWTPAWWGWGGGLYLFHPGYWGPHVGFYGGINYGFGYFGTGFAGGYWHHGAFAYNRAYNNFGDVHVRNAYNRTVVNNVTSNRVSYHGGQGGSTATPTREQARAAHEHHLAPTGFQQQHVRTAATAPDQRASSNHGAPAMAATSRPAQFGHPANAAPARGQTQAQPNQPQTQPQAHSNRPATAAQQAHATPQQAGPPRPAPQAPPQNYRQQTAQRYQPPPQRNQAPPQNYRQQTAQRYQPPPQRAQAPPQRFQPPPQQYQQQAQHFAPPPRPSAPAPSHPAAHDPNHDRHQ